MKIRKILKDIVAKNLSVKISALLLTLLLWLVITSTNKVEVVKKVTLDFITAQGFVVTNNVNNEVDVRLSGPSVFLRQVMDVNDVVTIDVRERKVGSYSYKLYNNMIKMPLGVNVVSFFPSELSFRVEPAITKKVRVLPSFTGQVPEGYRLLNSSVEPQEVELEGAESLLANLEEVYTQIIDLSDINKNTSMDLELDQKYASRFKKASFQKFSVDLQVEPVQITRRFYNIKLNVLGVGNFNVANDTINVTVEGPKLVVKDLSESDINAYIDVSFNAQGTYNEKVNVSLPKGLKALSIEPSKVKVVVR